ncbi:PLDc N-terminal domain-containing protein [Salegentibacter agarivorans]
MTILVIALIILTAILWIWALVDISRSRFENPSMKWLWIILIFIFPILGSLVYFQFGKKYTKDPKKFNPDFNKNSKY